MYEKIHLQDKEVEKAINNELTRQQEYIELIASENYVSEDIQKATGSIMTNKYAEGYPNKRYYDGCENIDTIESLAIARLKKLFNVKYANVQAHSGSSANASAIAAVIKPGAKILGMKLTSGGHLTHGYKISFSGTFYESYNYETDKNGLINYNDVLKIAKKVKPDLIICGYSAYSRIFDFKKFREIADKVGAILLADIAHIAGLIIAGLHPSPVEHAQIITSTTHKTLRGARGGIIMTNNEEIAKKINRWVFPGYQGGPLGHSIAGKAVSFYEALQPFFITYQKQIITNCYAFSEKFKSLGAKIVSNGTDNHLFTINTMFTYQKSGKEVATIWHENKITTNKNTIPYDTLSPFVTSGVRMGTAAMTSRGFKEKDFEELALIMHEIIKKEISSKEIKTRIKKLTSKHPIRKSYFENQ